MDPTYIYIPSLKLTYPLKIGLPNRKVVFQPSIFRGYVSFREGIHTPEFKKKMVLSSKNLEQEFL